MSIFDFYLEMLVSWEWYVCALLALFMSMSALAKLRKLKVDSPDKGDINRVSKLAQEVISATIYLLTWPLVIVLLWCVTKPNTGRDE